MAGSDQGSMELIEEILVDDTLVEPFEQPEDKVVEVQTQNPMASQTKKSPIEVIKFFVYSWLLCLSLSFHFLFRMLMIH
jgi:hypothetical protein